MVLIHPRKEWLLCTWRFLVIKNSRASTEVDDSIAAISVGDRPRVGFWLWGAGEPCGVDVGAARRGQIDDEEWPLRNKARVAK